RRRTARRELRQEQAASPRPRRQPATQLRPPPHRRYPRPLAPTRTRLPGTQTGRGQDTPRSTPLPQTTARPHRLHNPQERATVDIGATLGQPWEPTWWRFFPPHRDALVRGTSRTGERPR